VEIESRAWWVIVVHVESTGRVVKIIDSWTCLVTTEE